MAFAAIEGLRRVGWKVSRPSSTDTLHRRPELHLERQGYLITCIQDSLPAGLKAIKLGPTKKGVESVMWNPTVLQVTDERFRREPYDTNGKKTHEHAQRRIDWLNRYAPRKYTFHIRNYPEEAVLIKIVHKPTPEDSTNPVVNSPNDYVATASPAAGTSR